MSSINSVAVVIVAWQDLPELDDCLESLRTQRDRDFEVIVADNGAGLAERVEPWANRLTIRHLDLGENLGVSLARNRAVEACDAEILLFLDDDAIADADWVATYRSVFDDSSIAAARGRVRGKSDSMLNDLARAYDLGDERVSAIINTEGNCAIRRTDFERVGGFDPKMFGHEGAEISSRLAATRGSEDAIVYEPSAVIYHDYVDSVGGYLKKRYRHGMMVEHLSMEVLRKSAVKSRRRAKWTRERVALLPVKAAGVGAEAIGAVRSRAA